MKTKESLIYYSNQNYTIQRGRVEMWFKMESDIIREK